MYKHFLGVMIVFVLAGCEQQTENRSDMLFTKIPGRFSNITFNNTLEEDEHFNIIEYLYFYNGGGVSIGDINNDGLADIYFTKNQGHNALYLNEGNFKFKDITQAAGVQGTGNWTTGVTMADVNADGLLDIYVCGVGNYKHFTGINQLFINNGDLTFTERSAEFGLHFQGFSTQAAFLIMI
ncbi:MAG: VCBS repeat-containing protein [Cyclobacteriaceae bacterium]|nr:MAG: VCBS repeat-containing protein [Cyclobacteriaceae bacterium]